MMKNKDLVITGRAASTAIGTSPKKPSGLLNDVIVAEVPHLAIVSLEEFRQVLTMRPTPKGKHTNQEPLNNHPFKSKWRCPRCGSNLHFDKRRKWLRCANAEAWKPGQENPCGAPPIDLAAGERLMFEALETFSPGRGGAFAERASKRFQEALTQASAEREQLKKEKAKHEAALDSLADELLEQRSRPHLRASIERRSDMHALELERIVAAIQDMPAAVETPDPAHSLISLENMIEAIKCQTPFGFGVNRQAATFATQLRKAILGITMIELGNDHYDVEFELNASAALGLPGEQTELVRFANQNLKAGRFKSRTKEALLKEEWDAGKYWISDRAWKKIPHLPIGERTFQDDWRWVVNTMIFTAETGKGTNAIVRMAGNRVVAHRVQLYRSSNECMMTLRDWLQDVRSRKHGYEKMLPARKGQTTLRERMAEVEFPLLDLARFRLLNAPAPLNNDEFQRLTDLLPQVETRLWDSMRYRIDQTIAMIRTNGSYNQDGRHCYRGWLKSQIKRGILLPVVNFFRQEEGFAPVQTIPEIPNSRQVLRPRDRQGNLIP